MLPSTGYFKGINCPFYDSGFCERRYCHFRHVKKDSQNNDEIDGGSILQKLVSAAVQKVFRQTEAGAQQSIQSSEVSETNKKPNNVQTLIPKPTYNPTPIAELNKINNNTDVDADDGKEQKRKHIPVPYTPRKPASIPVKRPVDGNGCNLFTYIPPAKYTPGSNDNNQLDPYTPKGSKESGEIYLPGTGVELQEYTPSDTQTTTKLNYIPSDKNSSKKKVLEYKPTKVVKAPNIPSVTYKPTPRSLAPCFSSDEDEPELKKVKISSDLNGLDELGAEFDILDQILDEEKSERQTDKLEKSNDNSNNSNDNKTDEINKASKKQDQTHKENVKKLDQTHIDKKQDRKEDRKSRSSGKSSHKSSHRDKDKHDKDKERTKDRKEGKSDSEKKSLKKEHSLDKESRHTKSSSKHSKDLKHKHESSRHKSHKHSKEKKDEKHKKKKESSPTRSFDDNDNNDADESDVYYKDNYVSSESDEEAIALECKRIFEEYVPTEKIVSETDGNKTETLENEEEYVPGKKRISRTGDKNIKVVEKPRPKPDFKAHAVQAMANRLAKVREFHASKNALLTAKSIENHNLKVNMTKPIASTPTSGSSKIRIAHVPYASTMLSAKKTISICPISRPQPAEPSTSTTIVQTVKKGSQRVAHIPSEKFIDRPGVLEPLASKIPANIRSTYLNMMIDNCLNIYLTAEDAYARAQHEELATSKKCSTIPIYKNSAVLTISRLKKELKECNGVKKSGSDCIIQKIPQAVSGTVGTTGSWSIESKNRNSVESAQLTGAKLYHNISKWILTEEQLQENGFPRPHTSGAKGRAIIYKQNKQTPPKGSFRTCCRCKKDYTIDKKGFPVNKEECIYHPNNKYRIRGEVRYQCCSQDGSSDGCCIASCHVYEYVDYENLKGYVKTLPPDSVQDDYGVYSLDCEMCYTTQGLDLTRITVIDSSCKVVYETLVRPLHPIIDYNTRYSGITEDQMSQVKTTLLEVQATLLTMFTSKTILIGHSLESDFKALKLIHDTIIDTSVLYPHKMGPPYKRALRNLSSEYLKKIIQNSVDGHDSAEDATVCMELILYKLKEDLKTR